METPILSQSDFLKRSGVHLRRLIGMLGLTQVKAAEIMGITKHVLRNWLAGEDRMNPYAIYRLCQAKGVDFNYIFLGDWHRLPYELAQEMEAELATKLAAATAPVPQDAGTVET